MVSGRRARELSGSARRERINDLALFYILKII